MIHMRALGGLKTDRSIQVLLPLPIQVTGGAIMFRGHQFPIPFPSITQDFSGCLCNIHKFLLQEYGCICKRRIMFYVSLMF